MRKRHTKVWVTRIHGTRCKSRKAARGGPERRSDCAECSTARTWRGSAEGGGQMRANNRRSGWLALLALIFVWPLLVVQLSTSRSWRPEGLSAPVQLHAHVGLSPAALHSDEEQHSKRPSIPIFVGVQVWNSRTPKKFVYEMRREQLRKTWFPSDETAMYKMEKSLGVVMRFVIGQTDNKTAEEALQGEIKQYGPMLRLGVKESYMDLAWKTHSFFRTVLQHWDAEFIVKADDDVYMRPDRLPAALPGYRHYDLGYIGCMKRGGIVKTEGHRWYEPQHELLGDGNYFTHAWGPMYILSGKTAKLIADFRSDNLRHFVNEDVTVGAWMMMFNVRSFDDRRLCTPVCTALSIAAYPVPACQGLCSPVDDLPKWHANQNCSATTTIPAGKSFLPMYHPIIDLGAVIRHTTSPQTEE